MGLGKDDPMRQAQAPISRPQPIGAHAEAPQANDLSLRAEKTV